ncbi:hypothetical protein GCM10011391_17820 [Pullulanibacillus camelliae]|uniref:Uncharacterized protein n=1 Tax=Pullulanibacillus camelliae TaxID=1707096 RepID=A0A8J2YDA6_9BACL|nr:hypothetical protein [Pullulanibacillus camelliae]GGE39457.1 hypothetical protein GCM10011391_17820 [Pullulanibacillus camelliae]
MLSALLILTMYGLVGSIFSLLILGVRNEALVSDRQQWGWLFCTLLVLWLPLAILSLIIGPFVKSVSVDSHI